MRKTGSSTSNSTTRRQQCCWRIHRAWICSPPWQSCSSRWTRCWPLLSSSPRHLAPWNQCHRPPAPKACTPKRFICSNSACPKSSVNKVSRSHFVSLSFSLFSLSSPLVDVDFVNVFQYVASGLFIFVDEAPETNQFWPIYRGNIFFDGFQLIGHDTGRVSVEGQTETVFLISGDELPVFETKKRREEGRKKERKKERIKFLERIRCECFQVVFCWGGHEAPHNEWNHNSINPESRLSQ